MTSRNESVWQQQVLAYLTPEQRAEFMSYSNKGAGWFVVGAGAALIGIKEASITAANYRSQAQVPCLAKTRPQVGACRW
jgi:hypothetical protein